MDSAVYVHIRILYSCPGSSKHTEGERKGETEGCSQKAFPPIAKHAWETSLHWASVQMPGSRILSWNNSHKVIFPQGYDCRVCMWGCIFLLDKEVSEKIKGFKGTHIHTHTYTHTAGYISRPSSLTAQYTEQLSVRQVWIQFQLCSQQLVTHTHTYMYTHT